MAESAAAGRLIVLTGPIGAGKTTVAAELIQQMEAACGHSERSGHPLPPTEARSPSDQRERTEQELAAPLQRPTAYIEGDRFWKFIAKPRPGPHQEAFRIILRAMSETAVTFARGGYEALLDFSMPPEYLDRASRLFRGVSVHLAVLRPSLATCVERAASRSSGAIRDAQALAEFYELFRNVPERRLITEESAPPAAIARCIRTRLDQGDFLWPETT